MNRDFLKEAIADAKAVKESAIANAKIALEEAFNPQLKSMLSAKLEEMDKTYEEDDVTEEAEVSEEIIDETISEEKDEMDEEMNLDEILNELEESEESLEEGDIAEESTIDEAEEEEAEEEEADEAEEKEEDEIDIEDMSEDDLKKFIEGVIEDMVESGELEAGEEEEAEGTESEEEIDMDIDDMDVEIEAEEEIEEEVVAEEEEIEVDEEMKGELDEAYATIKSLKSELQEINLLNAKLLYSNKIFKAKTLSESQKAKVLGTFDKATTVKEVKLVFETINESLKTKTTKRISENMIGSASRVTTTPKRAKKPIIESDAMVSRFQKLAGIKKN